VVSLPDLDTRYPAGPQNLGTLLRTAEVTGVHGVATFPAHGDGDPSVVHASSGASEHLLVVQINLAQAITSLKEAGVWVIGLESGAQALPPEQVRLDGPLALVVAAKQMACVRWCAPPVICSCACPCAGSCLPQRGCRWLDCALPGLAGAQLPGRLDR